MMLRATLNWHRLSGSTILLVLGAVALLAVGNLAFGIEVPELREYLPFLARGMGITLLVTLVTFFTGGLLALPIAIAGVATSLKLRRFASCYFFLFRYTPLIAQLYLVYYGAGEFSSELRSIGVWWLFRDPLGCVFMVFTLNTSAYQAYVMAGAIRTLPREQKEAAYALGLRPSIALRKVLIPQAMLVAIRPLGNELTKMIKASSIASVVTIYDLLGATKTIYSDTFNFNYFILTGMIYIALVEFTRIGVEGCLRRLELHKKSANS